MFGIHRNFPAGGGDTSDATAEQWDIKNGKTAYIASGKVTGTAYTPALMKMDGSTGYFSKTGLTTSGDLVTLLGRFKAGTFTSNYRWIGGVDNGTRVRAEAAIGPTDAATVDERGKLVCFSVNSAGSTVCRLVSDVDVNDDTLHTFLYAYNGTTGAAVLIIDGSDADNGSASSRVLTTGTLGTGASSRAAMGRNAGVGSALLACEIGFFGYMDAYLTTWSDFMRSDGSPIYQDPASSWSGSGFGAQPLIYNPHGDLANNLGSGGAFTRNGTINVGDGGAT